MKASGIGQTVGAIQATRSCKQLQGVLCMSTGQANAEILEDSAPTLNASHEQPICVVYGNANAAVDENANMQTIFQEEEYGLEGCIVRRLTPTECERLQGFPDGWTNVPDFDGKPMSDAQRYKQLGNSMAVPVMRWIGERMRGVDDDTDHIRKLTKKEG